MEHLGRRLQNMMNRFLPHLLEVKGRGMMRGIRAADPARAAAVTKKAFGYGLIIERSGPKDEVIKCLMPLTITMEELNEGLDRLEQALVDEFGDFSETADLPTPATVEKAA